MLSLELVYVLYCFERSVWMHHWESVSVSGDWLVCVPTPHHILVHCELATPCTTLELTVYDL